MARAEHRSVDLVFEDGDSLEDVTGEVTLSLPALNTPAKRRRYSGRTISMDMLASSVPLDESLGFVDLPQQRPSNTPPRPQKPTPKTLVPGLLDDLIEPIRPHRARPQPPQVVAEAFDLDDVDLTGATSTAEIAASIAAVVRREAEGLPTLVDEDEASGRHYVPKGPLAAEELEIDEPTQCTEGSLWWVPVIRAQREADMPATEAMTGSAPSPSADLTTSTVHELSSDDLEAMPDTESEGPRKSDALDTEPATPSDPLRSSAVTRVRPAEAPPSSTSDQVPWPAAIAATMAVAGLLSVWLWTLLPPSP